MSAIIIVVVVAAIVAAVFTALGTGLLAIVLVPIAIVVVGWALLLGASRMRTGDVVRREHERSDQEFLGPGGPDDPDR